MSGSHDPYWRLAQEMARLRRSPADTVSARAAALRQVAAECGAELRAPEGSTLEALAQELMYCAEHPGGLAVYLEEFSRGHRKTTTWQAVQQLHRQLFPSDLLEPHHRRALHELLECSEQAPRLRALALRVLHESGAGPTAPEDWGPDRGHDGRHSEVAALLVVFEDLPYGWEDEPHPLLVFVETVAVREDGPLRARLHAWSGRVAAQLGCRSPQRLAQLRAEVAARAGRPAAPYRLLVEITARTPVPDVYTVRSWVVPPGPDGARPYGEPVQLSSRAAMEEEVAGRYLSCVHALGELSAGMLVEFLLPRPLLWLPVDQIMARPPDSVARPIGADHTVLVRSRDRWAKPHWRPRLHARADLLTTAPDTAFESAAVRVVPYGERLRPVELLRQLRHDHEQLGWLFLEPPPYTGGLEGDAVNVLLEMGIPVIVAVREVGEHPEAERKTRKVLAGRLMELPERVRMLRGEVGPDAEAFSVLDLHRHISLVWDGRDGLEGADAALGHPSTGGGLP
ncbi:hypothetical protein ABZV60_10405 [Streptomyces sp. NPDC004787]|uniref:VMAP-C domain-containing protein n=1 Tax=Streptomyces sp. NPDC004787 TaxID=3154291 RepID=UPI0033B8BEA5